MKRKISQKLKKEIDLFAIRVHEMKLFLEKIGVRVDDDIDKINDSENSVDFIDIIKECSEHNTFVRKTQNSILKIEKLINEHKLVNYRQQLKQKFEIGAAVTFNNNVTSRHNVVNRVYTRDKNKNQLYNWLHNVEYPLDSIGIITDMSTSKKYIEVLFTNPTKKVWVPRDNMLVISQ